MNLFIKRTIKFFSYAFVTIAATFIAGSVSTRDKGDTPLLKKAKADIPYSSPYTYPTPYDYGGGDCDGGGGGGGGCDGG